MSQFAVVYGPRFLIYTQEWQ